MARNSSQALSIEETLGVGRAKRSIFSRWWFWLLIVVIGAWVAYMVLVPAPKTQYTTELVERGSIASKVDATGSLEPVDKVTVGAEISGRIDEVLVDYNDRVVQGQVLARINTDDLVARLTQARASLANAKANLLQAQATQSDAQRAYDRIVPLRDSGYASTANFENAKAARDRADAQVAASRAQVQQQEASVKQAETNLSKAEIKSPIDGVVLERKVQAGQTVQASFNTPELFVIASDLRQMELQVYIDEADIAEVKPGQRATFTVDAFEDRKFNAQVQSVRTSPRTLNNVVAYLATLTVDNSDNALRPGLTATAEITTASATNVILVPNGALRFEPDAKPNAGSGVSVSIGGRGGPNIRPGGGNNQNGKKEKTADEGTLYVLDKNGDPEKRSVRTGITDGTKTEVKSGNLKIGEKVITDVALPNAKP
jgi:HlyD family secretion protein